MKYMKLIIKVTALVLLAVLSGLLWFGDYIPTQQQAIAGIQHPDWIEFVEQQTEEKPSSEPAVDPNVIPIDGILSEKDTLLYNAIINGIEDGETQVIVENTNYDEPSIQKIINYMGYNSPEFFYISFFDTHFIIDSYGTAVNLTYTYSAADLEQRTTDFEAAINLAVNEVKAQNFTTQYETAVYIYDYLIRNVSYDYTLSRTDIHNAYGALVNKTAVCDGYALAFSLIADRVGIDSYVIIGHDTDPETEEGHAWNKVKLDGVVTNLDVTWDDLDLEENTDVEIASNAVSHAYFGISDQQLAIDHIINNEVSVPLPAGEDINWFDKNGFTCADPSEITDVLAKALSDNLSGQAGYFEVKITDPEEFNSFISEYEGGVDAIIEAANELQEEKEGPLFQTTASFPITHEEIGTVLVVCPIEQE